MRVITGKFKGRRLQAPSGLALRPTSDRIKESLFNILGSTVVGTAWLDLFAGTGAIGIEALSRGARRVVFVEKERRAWQALEHNLRHCRIQEGTHIIRREARLALRECIEAPWTFDIIFLDPPYQADQYNESLHFIAANRLLVDGGLVIVERHRKIALRPAYGGLRLDQERIYGTTVLSFYTRSADVSADLPPVHTTEPG